MTVDYLDPAHIRAADLAVAWENGMVGPRNRPCPDRFHRGPRSVASLDVVWGRPSWCPVGGESK